VKSRSKMLKITGSKIAKKIINETMLHFPENITEYIYKNVWFICSFDDAWAFTFDANDLRGRKLIFLSDQLFEQDQKQMMYTIAHEVGHVILGHRNAIYKDQSKHEINLQEKEAHKFAKRYLN